MERTHVRCYVVFCGIEREFDHHFAKINGWSRLTPAATGFFEEMEWSGLTPAATE
jgi:hypothetical protein